MKDTQEKIKVLVVEDSGLMRIMLSDALRSDPLIAVVGTANNGKEGVEKSMTLKPDVVVTDMVMPEYDGLYVVKNIMSKNPLPIFLLSSLDRANTQVFDALNAGAVDFVDKPVNNGTKSFERSVSNLLSKIKMASSLNTAITPEVGITKNQHHHTFSDSLKYELITIGASTGGPSAIESVLEKLPANLALPVIIAQHMPHRFIQSFCSRLGDKLPLNVQIAKDNQPLSSGIYLLPGTSNMKLIQNERGQIQFKKTTKKFKEFNDPSIDSLFESVAEIFQTRAIATILTGMGRDGVMGLKKIRESGGITIAQDETSCVVNGMPQAARDAQAVDYTVKLKDIPGFIISCL